MYQTCSNHLQAENRPNLEFELFSVFITRNFLISQL